MTVTAQRLYPPSTAAFLETSHHGVTDHPTGPQSAWRMHAESKELTQCCRSLVNHCLMLSECFQKNMHQLCLFFSRSSYSDGSHDNPDWLRSNSTPFSSILNSLRSQLLSLFVFIGPYSRYSIGEWTTWASRGRSPPATKAIRCSYPKTWMLLRHSNHAHSLPSRISWFSWMSHNLIIFNCYLISCSYLPVVPEATPDFFRFATALVVASWWAS